MTDFARLVLDTDTRGLRDGERDLRGVGDQAKRTAREVDGAASGMASAFKKVGVALVAAGIGNVIYDFGKQSVQAAIDAQEMESAFDVVFGNMAADVRSWAEETGNALGRSTQEIQRAALSFQELFGKALDPAQSAELSKQFAVLTQDLASFKNLSNEVAQQKLFSGLVGEAEPLRAVGVFLSENALQARAAAMGLGDFSKELTDQEKIVVRAAEIQAQLAQASGDVERTSGSTANQIKTMNAAVEELQVAIGSKLLPLFTPLVSKTAEIITAMANAAQGFDAAGLSIGRLMNIVTTAGAGWAAYRLTLMAATAATALSTSGLVAQAGAIAAASARLGIMGSVTAATTVATRTLFGVLAANPLGAIALAVGGLTAAMVNLGNAQRQARAETDNLIRSLRGLAQARSAEYATARAEIMADLSAEQTEMMRAEAELAGSLGTSRLTDAQLRDALEGRGGRLSTVPGAPSNIREQAQEVYRLRQSVIKMEGELVAAGNAFERAEDAANSIKVPVADAASAISSMGEAGRKSASELDDAFSRLYDRLFPEEAANRQLAVERRLIESNENLTAARKAEILAALEQERIRRRAGDFIDLDAPINNSQFGLIGQISALEYATLKIDATLGDLDHGIVGRFGETFSKFDATLGKTTDHAQTQTTMIADSFAQMSQRITSSLQNLASNIRSGGFLSIFSGILDIFMQLGSAGLFGSSIQKNLNKPITGGRAYGGQVNAGRTYLVGERGPELFTPSGHGRIIANDNMGGGMVFNIDARGATDPEAVRQQVQQGILEAAPSIVAAAEQRTISTLRRPRLAGVM